MSKTFNRAYLMNQLNLNEEKVFFKAGDIVTLKHNMPNKPIMLVKGKETTLIRKDDATHFKGMKCIWFATDLSLQEAVFSTKDLIHVQ